jgi:integrase
MTLVSTIGAMRPSELSGLDRTNLDLEKGVIEITQSHTEGRLGAPKTRGSRRTVHLPDEVVEVLRDYVAWQDEQKFKGRPILFPTSVGSRRTPASVNDVLDRLATAAGITKHVTSYALRRTSNNLLRQTAGELVARAVTGHVTQEMTDHYSEYDHEERTAAWRSAFGAALGQVAPVPPKAVEAATALEV